MKTGLSQKCFLPPVKREIGLCRQDVKAPTKALASISIVSLLFLPLPLRRLSADVPALFKKDVYLRIGSHVLV